MGAEISGELEEWEAGGLERWTSGEHVVEVLEEYLDCSPTLWGLALWSPQSHTVVACSALSRVANVWRENHSMLLSFSVVWEAALAYSAKGERGSMG